ncbi:hypothetical protein P8891_05725 [Bacillus atrophaeus]|nr:hypothetical protein [Bacillus atrophaeus]MEC0740586.1 hypothetical protein [Bacillus atrophaeus]MEC0746978.1 hypothetical protein [Bacillus atrophaeus]MEC0760444.1 hypothetical protein [Bacillus atrophaeus]MEC0915973.1 hypothetical protein [Bacillus atrophaeus]MEC0963077.1 hypothetical protein [Bacillus atrophaeus]
MKKKQEIQNKINDLKKQIKNDGTLLDALKKKDIADFERLLNSK